MINRADMGDRRVHDYAARENLPILLEIPFDREVAKTYARGELLVEKFPDWRSMMLALYAMIQEEVLGGRMTKAGRWGELTPTRSPVPI